MRGWSVLLIIMALAFSVGGCKKRPRRAKRPTYPLHSAASRGDLEEVHRLLSRGADANVRDYDGETPLHGAALGGHMLIAQTLIAHGAEIDAINDSNCTPLHGAAGSGEANMVELLIENGASADVWGKWREQTGTPLHLAAPRGHRRIVRVLCDGGADVGIRNENGRTALDLAVCRDKRETADLLAVAGGEITVPVAAYLGDMERLKQAVAEGYDINASPGNGCRALHTVAKQGNREMVAWLLDHGAEVNPEHYSPPLHLAVEGGHEDTVSHAAAPRENLDVVELLLTHGADPSAQNVEGETPLDVAIRGGRTEVAELLRKHMARP